MEAAADADSSWGPSGARYCGLTDCHRRRMYFRRTYAGSAWLSCSDDTARTAGGFWRLRWACGVTVSGQRGSLRKARRRRLCLFGTSLEQHTHSELRAPHIVCCEGHHIAAGSLEGRGGRSLAADPFEHSGRRPTFFGPVTGPEFAGNPERRSPDSSSFLSLALSFMHAH